MENKLAAQTGTNQAVKQAVSGTVSSAIQGLTNGTQGSKGIPPPVNYNASDNTRVKKPIIPLTQ
ncbi:MAG: hypothetical protein JNL51_14350 [Chitinophagaceae bacterium]|nr:hypothetical protein [Chitinophagaceae bacterium]